MKPMFWFLDAMAQADVEARLVRAEAAASREESGGTVLARRPTRDAYGAEIEQMRMAGSVAIVPVKGPLLKGAHPIYKQYGFADYDDVKEDMRAAREQGAQAVVLNIASPGGMAVGAGQLGAFVAEFARHTPVYSFTDEMQCSAAEYLSGACTLRLASADAIVGSIGTVMVTVSFQGMLDEAGIKAEVFASGPFKAAGNRLKDNTPEQSQYLQEFVDNLAGEFKGHMLNYRAAFGLNESAMQGQVFTGRQGVSNGLLSRNARSLDEAVELAMRLEFPLGR